MVYFQTKKIPICVNFRGLRSENADIFLWSFGIFYGQLGYFVTIWYIFVNLVRFSGFGIMYQEKSGNPAVGLNGFPWLRLSRAATNLNDSKTLDSLLVEVNEAAQRRAEFVVSVSANFYNYIHDCCNGSPVYFALLYLVLHFVSSHLQHITFDSSKAALVLFMH
jgi:hypothetical protein